MIQRLAVVAAVVALTLTAGACHTQHPRREGPPEGQLVAEETPEEGGPGPRIIRDLGDGQAIVNFYVTGFTESDGGPRLVRQKLEDTPGIAIAIYDAGEGAWRVRYQKSRYTIEALAAKFQEIAWEQLRDEVEVHFMEDPDSRSDPNPPR